MDLIHQRIQQPDQSHLHLDLHSAFNNNSNYNNYTEVFDWDAEFAPEFEGRGVEFDVDDEEYRIVRGDDNDSDDLMLPLWDSLVLNDRNERNNEGFEWEEIGGMVNEGEGDAFVPVLSEEEEEEEEEGGGGGGGGGMLDVEWEDLMNRELYFEGMIDREFSLGDQIVGRLLEGEDVGRGKPPASEKEVERLGIVVVSERDLEMGNVICAVCKDDMDVGEEVREMPCGHRYHGDCILPWLRIRNTCPVCRFELPTDDTDYERTRAQRVGRAN